MSERAKIRRGTQPRRRRAVVTPRRASVAPRAKTGVAARALATIPLPIAKIRRWSWRALWVLIAVALGVLLLALRVPAIIGNAFGAAAGDAGLAVSQVEIVGTHHLDKNTAESIVFDQPKAMPLLDLGAIRAKLLRFGWVKDARVSRRLPDTVLIDIVERKPAAIWQYHEKLNLIDGDGVVLAPVDLAHMPDLPIVVGPDANLQAGGLAALLDAAPALKPMLAAASWIGGRRWDLRFQSGETLALPEGDDAARVALAKFQRMDQATPLLGRNYSHFDMRIEGRFYARVKGDPGGEIGTPDKPAPDAT